MIYSLFLLLGAIASLPLLYYVHNKDEQLLHEVLGRCLLIAALIYVAFALLWGDSQWVVFEVIGVLIFGLFIRGAKRYSLYFLALGWGLHPIWDVGLHLIGPGRHIAPSWYVVVCISFDFAVAIYIFNYLRKHKPSKTP